MGNLLGCFAEINEYSYLNVKSFRFEKRGKIDAVWPAFHAKGQVVQVLKHTAKN